MKLKLMSYAISAFLAASATGACAGLLPKDEIAREHGRINATFRMEKQACDNFSGNTRDTCMAEAKGKVKVAKAVLEARDKETPKARQDADLARAQAAYDVAMQRCNDLAGNLKDVCVTDARAELVKAKTDAILKRKTADANASAADTVIQAQVQASNVKREADYNAARERCNALAGNAKIVCVNEVRSRFALP